MDDTADAADAADADTPGWVQPWASEQSESADPPPQAPPAPPQYPPPPQYTPPPQYGQYPPPPQYGQYPPPASWGAPWGNYQQEYKPGIVPLRPLSVGEVLDGSFSTIRKHPRIVFGSAAVLAIVAELIRLGVGAALNNVSGALGATSFSTSPDQTSSAQLHALGSSLTGALVSLVVNALCVALLAGVVTGVVGKAVIGQRPDGREILTSVRKRWLGLLAVSVLAELLPFAPALLVVVGILLGTVSIGFGIFIGVLGGVAALVLCPLLWGRLAVAVPIFVLERRGPGAAIARSWRLVRGAFWRVFLLRALVTLIVAVAASALSVPLFLIVIGSAVAGRTPSTIALVFVVIVGVVVWMITQPITAAALTLIYIDRRMRAEGLDMQLTQAARAAAATAGAAGAPPT
jgi:Membrane domain of glycerophosphoryl diester phosphodiesterase